ncbi:major histocompatibility complex class I-related gene protein-like isoform X2 [Sceloporus undulatus]|uniref:major histocompatibility complex class I-related gene protein-like isoform X2 n=1 Tax=Sceloporus undulatus TaxID=8520 RepID=UPI001C4DC984|nr:major histocompatibility complex class I-related gene protein-like isoform X2 [Sceloporus undulatus]
MGLASLLLGTAVPILLLLLLLWACPGSPSHSFRYAATVVSKPSAGLPRFTAAEYVDDCPISHYDSHSKRELPQALWGEDNLDAHFWDTRTQFSQENEQECGEALGIFQDHYNQTSHSLLDVTILQWTYGCELSEEGQIKAYERLAYDGEEVMSFNLETLKWRAGSDSKSQALKRLWDGDAAYREYRKHLLEEDCVALLRKYLDYGRGSLRRKEPPAVKVLLHKTELESLESLMCQIRGFYPKELDASWMKDGVNMEQETFRAGVVPNSDGTYHTWLRIMIDPKERGRFRCHVEHDGLPTPLDVAWEAPAASASNVGLMAGVIIAVSLLVAVFGITVYVHKQKRVQNSGDITCHDQTQLNGLLAQKPQGLASAEDWDPDHSQGL